MNAVLEKMTNEETDEKRPPAPTSCSHADTRKVVRFGKRCAICDRRVWKFWKTRKCQDCKIVLHRSCVAAWEKHTARQAIGPYPLPPMVTTTEAKPDRAATTVTVAERARNRVAPMYLTPRPWTFENTTAVTVDCRRRAAPLSVIVSHGYALTAALFRGLFVSSSPPSTWKSDFASAVHAVMAASRLRSSPRQYCLGTHGTGRPETVTGRIYRFRASDRLDVDPVFEVDNGLDLVPYTVDLSRRRYSF